MPNKMTARDIIKGYDKAYADRLTVMTTWQDLAYYVTPRKRGVLDFIEPGDKLPHDLFDDTAIQSNIILAAGLSGFMTNSSQRWFELAHRDRKLMDDNDVRSFFADSQDIMFAALGTSNFYQQIHETYLDLGALGTANLYEEPDEKEDIRFSARHPKELSCIENKRGVVDMVYRMFDYSAKQAVEDFGEENVSDEINEAIKNQDYGKMFEFIHHVAPRHVRDVTRDDSANMPFMSIWVEKKAMKIVAEGGYEEFPYFVSRFYKNSGEVYGYAPSHVSYSDIRSLNKMLEIYTKGAEIAVYPPWLMESDSMIGTLDLRAASINYQKQPLRLGAAVQPLGSGMNIQIAIDYINRTEKNIKDAFFSDLFLMMTQNHNMTATEVIERSQEKMLMLGPVLGRLQTELLNPIIFRTFSILHRRGKLPPIPDKLKDKKGAVDLDVVYVSPLAKAQRAIQAQDMQTYLGIIGNMAQLMPDVLDNINSDEVAERFSKIYSVDPDILNDEETRTAIREDRAKAQQQAAQLQMLQAAVESGKTLSETGKNEAESAATV